MEKDKPRTEAVMLGILSVLLFCHANYCFRLWILCGLLTVKYSVSICSFLVFDVTLELHHSCNWNARVPRGRSSCVRVRNCHIGRHIPVLFLLHFQFAVGRVRRASTKRQIRGWVIELKVRVVKMRNVSDWCWGGAMEMCPEGALRADEYLSSFNLSSLTVWRHNIQNEVTNCDSFGANPEFCFSQGKALLGYRGLSASHEQQLLGTCLWFKTEKLKSQLLCPAAWPKPCCLWVQLLSPALTPLTPGMVWLIIEQKERYETTSEFKIHHLGPWKRDLGGKILHSPGERPSLASSYKFSRSENESIPKGQRYPVKELQK